MAGAQLTTQWVDSRVIVAVQMPAWQESPVEQTLPSLQLVPSARGAFEHDPLVGSHTPGPWQESVAGQDLGAPPEQVPAWQVSPVVQELPSLQVVPLATTGLVQLPLVGSQTPAVWQASVAAQVFGLPPTQAPAWQESTVVQGLLSLQAVPLETGGLVQLPVVASQIPAAWH